MSVGSVMRNVSTKRDGIANSVESDQTASLGSALFAQTYVPQYSRMTRKTLLPDIIGLRVPSIGLSCVVILQMHSTVREITQAFEMRFYQRVMKNFYKEHVTE